jgi:hypothetical protein
MRVRQRRQSGVTIDEISLSTLLLMHLFQVLPMSDIEVALPVGIGIACDREASAAVAQRRAKSENSGGICVVIARSTDWLAELSRNIASLVYVRPNESVRK